MTTPDGEPRPTKGPWTHRFLIFAFSVLLTLLFAWLLGFVLRDIGTWPAPSYLEVEARHLDPVLVEQAEDLTVRLEETRRRIRDQQERQALLRDSTTSSQNTMGQLLEIQRLSLEKGVAVSEQELQALNESKDLFLSNQQRYQQLNDDVAQLKETERELVEQKKVVDAGLEVQREQAREEHRALMRRHNLKVAALKLLVLIPLAGGVLFLFLKKRSSLYAPFIYAGGLALLWRIGLVLHEHFPARYFKYILILFSLAVVGQILVYLLRMVAFPKREWLLKQRKEAYERFLCPVCSFPIRRGPLKYTFWTARTIRKLPVPGGAGEADQPYSCPACGSALFEKCDQCGQVRHSLLPSCEHCGALKEREPAGQSAQASSGSEA